VDQPRPLSRPDIPARARPAAWTRFHTLVVVALGITWVSDGLEYRSGLDRRCAAGTAVLHFTAAEWVVGSAYLIGAITGAVLSLSDRPVRPQTIVHGGVGFT